MPLPGDKFCFLSGFWFGGCLLSLSHGAVGGGEVIASETRQGGTQYRSDSNWDRTASGIWEMASSWVLKKFSGYSIGMYGCDPRKEVMSKDVCQCSLDIYLDS